jgi:hypothetical protein
MLWTMILLTVEVAIFYKIAGTFLELYVVGCCFAA